MDGAGEVKESSIRGMEKNGLDDTVHGDQIKVDRANNDYNGDVKDGNKRGYDVEIYHGEDGDDDGDNEVERNYGADGGDDGDNDVESNYGDDFDDHGYNVIDLMR